LARERENTMSTTTNPAPGWYPHPQGVAATDMYWDGNGWQESMIRPQTPPPTRRSSRGPMTNSALDVKREVVYTRQQKGHSLTLHLLLGIVVLWVNVIYISVSPNHHWHI